MPEPLVQAFLARGLPLGNVYGATETGPFSIALTNDPERMLQGVCGWPCPGVQARLGPLEGASPDTGEVWLRGPALVRHYWPALPALDAQGWFHSGDVARVNADGSWTIVGRCKDMIISGGENIYPAEIEGLLGQHPAVAECAVLGVPDARWGERVVAVVVMHEQQAVSDDALLALVRERLARYKHPREVVRLQALPKTALGKVQKALLKERVTVQDVVSSRWICKPLHLLDCCLEAAKSGSTTEAILSAFAAAAASACAARTWPMAEASSALCWPQRSGFQPTPACRVSLLQVRPAMGAGNKPLAL